MYRVFVVLIVIAEALCIVIAISTITSKAETSYVPNAQERAALNQLIKCKVYGQQAACIPDIIQEVLQKSCKEKK
jgi:hypothetical protein